MDSYPLGCLRIKNHLQLCWNDFPCYWWSQLVWGYLTNFRHFDVYRILSSLTIPKWAKFNTLQEEASKTNAKVYRDGKLKEVLVDDIVKGDQILLQSGDKIPVDGIILEGELKVNQAVLNGESEDAKKLPLGNQAEPDSSDLFTELKVFRGTVVTSGEAVMEATQIGDNTVLGSINTSLQEDSKDSPSKENSTSLLETSVSSVIVQVLHIQ